MNYGISVLFRAIPLLMALFCFGYGWFVLAYGTDPSRFVAGPVVFSLGMICIALFSTAATIIRQIIHTFGEISRYALPVLGYLSALLTVIAGICIMRSPDASSFVAGHVIDHCLCLYNGYFFHPVYDDYRQCEKDGPRCAARSVYPCTGTDPDRYCRIDCTGCLGMGFLPVGQQRLWVGIFCSGTCHDRSGLYLYQSDSFGCNDCPADPEYIYSNGTGVLACDGIGHGKYLCGLGYHPDSGHRQSGKRSDWLYNDRVGTGLLQYIQ